MKLRAINVITAILCVIALSGCDKKTVLYEKLSEKDANFMLEKLNDSKINTEKIITKDGVTISVDALKVAQAIAVLRQHGFPKDTFMTIGDIFKSDKLVSSPVEEKIRLSYAISQSLSETISNIDGVLTARVHIVLDDTNKAKGVAIRSSAAVFIKHRPEKDFNNVLFKIKNLVMNSVPGLDYKKISIILFPADVD